MARNLENFKKVGIVGVGLIGGSLGLAIKEHQPQVKVWGFDVNQSTLKTALRRSAIDVSVSSLSQFDQVELVFVATPLSRLVEVVKELLPYLKPGTIITDTGSTKSAIVREVESFLPKELSFIGGHPLAGSEREGIEGATPHLFKNAFYVLTPTPATNSEAFLRLHGFLKTFGASVVALDPDRHDQIVAYISHLPHLVAASIVNVTKGRAKEEEGLLFFAASGFRDATRIAAGNPRLWRDIFFANREALLQAIEEFSEEVKKFQEDLQATREEEVEKLLAEAREVRSSLPAWLRKDPAKLWTIDVPLEDKPGVLSEVTVAIGKLGINIEDIELLHGEGRGVVKIAVSGEENAKKAAVSLKEQGYLASTHRYLEGV